MTDAELADEIERFSQMGGALVSTHEVQPPFRPKGDWVKSSDHDRIIAMLRELLVEVDSRFSELFRELPKDCSWWTAGDRRADKTWKRVRAMLAAAEAEGRKT